MASGGARHGRPIRSDSTGAPLEHPLARLRRAGAARNTRRNPIWPDVWIDVGWACSTLSCVCVCAPTYTSEACQESPDMHLPVVDRTILAPVVSALVVDLIPKEADPTAHTPNTDSQHANYKLGNRCVVCMPAYGAGLVQHHLRIEVEVVRANGARAEEVGESRFRAQGREAQQHHGHRRPHLA